VELLRESPGQIETIYIAGGAAAEFASTPIVEDVEVGHSIHVRGVDSLERLIRQLWPSILR
jgi:hypothetical protein